MIKNWKSFLESESKWDAQDILKELSWDLNDSGLSLEFPNDNKFKGDPYLSIYDEDKIYCKNYPEDDLDWLFNKPIMIDFYNKLDEFGLKRDKDYKVYGGGLGVNIVFKEEDIMKWWLDYDN